MSHKVLILVPVQVSHFNSNCQNLTSSFKKSNITIYSFNSNSELICSTAESSNEFYA